MSNASECISCRKLSYQFEIYPQMQEWSDPEFEIFNVNARQKRAYHLHAGIHPPSQLGAAQLKKLCIFSHSTTSKTG